MANFAPYGYKPPEYKEGHYIVSVHNNRVYSIYHISMDLDSNFRRTQDLKYHCQMIGNSTNEVCLYAHEMKPFYLQNGDVFLLKSGGEEKMVVVMKLEYRKVTGITARCVVAGTMNEYLELSKKTRQWTTFELGTLSRLAVFDKFTS